MWSRPTNVCCYGLFFVVVVCIVGTAHELFSDRKHWQQHVLYIFLFSTGRDVDNVHQFACTLSTSTERQALIRDVCSSEHVYHLWLTKTTMQHCNSSEMQLHFWSERLSIYDIFPDVNKGRPAVIVLLNNLWKKQLPNGRVRPLVKTLSVKDPLWSSLIYCKSIPTGLLWLCYF